MNEFLNTNSKAEYKTKIVIGSKKSIKRISRFLNVKNKFLKINKLYVFLSLCYILINNGNLLIKIVFSDKHQHLSNQPTKQ